MKKLLNILQPLIDHLYIFQLYEYQSIYLLKWFLRHPFKRRVQQKQHIEYTSHIKALLIITLGLMSFVSYFLSAGFASFFLIIILFLQISPLFIVIAELIFKPLEMYQRNKIVSRAIAKRKRLKDLQVIAIVGSYAKTSTKNMLYTLLWKDFKVVKTPKSYNTELSIARSMLADLKENTELFICEMDAYHTGEIDKLCQIAQPTHGVITAIGPQHLERFGSMDKLVSSQFELAKFIANQRVSESAKQSDKGILFLNQMDEHSAKTGTKLEQTVFFYNNDSAFISDRIENEHGQTFTLTIRQSKITIHLPILGEHQAINFLAAAVIADYLGLPLKTIAQRAELITFTEHRLEVKTVGNLTILDNTYNANPKAAEASLHLLHSYKFRQKILVTPGFVELGKEHNKAHKEFAKSAAGVIDDIIIVGEHAKKPILQGLESAKFNKKNIHLAETTQKALEHISTISKENAVVLLENDLPDQYS